MNRSTVQILTLAFLLLHAVISCASFYCAWERAALKKQAAENVELKRQQRVWWRLDKVEASGRQTWTVIDEAGRSRIVRRGL